MVSVNTIILGGHLGGPPEERRTAGGKLLCSFRLATNRREAGEETTDWHTVVAWERVAETCLKYLRKGSPVLIEGRLAMRQWDGTDGKKHTSAEVVASRVSFLNGSREGVEASPPPPTEVRAPLPVSKGFGADAVPF